MVLRVKGVSRKATRRSGAAGSKRSCSACAVGYVGRAVEAIGSHRRSATVAQETVDLHFFSKPCSTLRKNASRAARLAGRRLHSHSSYDGVRLQDGIGIERMCRLADVSRAGYCRHWQASSPGREEAGLPDVIQRLGHRGDMSCRRAAERGSCY